jgi:hypothetical protein
MPTTLKLKNDMSNWNASKNSKIKADDDKIQINIPKGGFASAGGVNLKFKPKGIKPTTEWELRLDIRVPDGFDFVKGGKIGVGANIGSGTGGKSWKTHDASARLMWRADGQLVGYLYMCTNQGAYKPDNMNCPLLKNQSSSFKDAIGHKAPNAGLDVWRYIPKADRLYLQRGKWNKVVFGGRLNSAGKSDGKLWLELNGKRRAVSGIRWADDPSKHKFTQLQMPTWFGGSNDSWAPQKNTWIKYRNVKYEFK